MQFWLYDHATNTRSTLELEGDPIVIGREDACHVVLKSPFVARKHARIVRKGNQLFVEALSRAGTRVANREVQPGSPARLDFGDEVQVGQFSLAPVGRDAQQDESPDERLLHEQLMELERVAHAELVDRMNLRITGHLDKRDPQFIAQLYAQLDDILRRRIAGMDPHVAVLAGKTHLRRLVLAEVVRQCQGKVATDYRVADERLLDPHLEQQLAETIVSIVDMMPLLFDPASVTEDLAVAEDAFEELFEPHFASVSPDLRRYLVQQMIAKDLQDILLGLGPLTDLLAM
ncbi:MAG: FHA domain-containing protein, partial [Planctomycetota bacterium]